MAQTFQCLFIWPRGKAQGPMIIYKALPSVGLSSQPVTYFHLIFLLPHFLAFPQLSRHTLMEGLAPLLFASPGTFFLSHIFRLAPSPPSYLHSEVTFSGRTFLTIKLNPFPLLFSSHTYHHQTWSKLTVF